MKTYRIEQLAEKIVKKFCSVGLSVEESHELCQQLLYAEMRGIQSHGLVRIAWILGQLNKYPRKEVSLLINKNNASLYDASEVLGYLALNQVVDSLPSSDGQTIKMVGIQNTYPTGALAYFSEKLSSKGWISIMSSSSPRRVGLSGDNKPLVGTNPWTFGLPIESPLGGYVVADTSLAELTHGQCLKLLATGNPLPTDAASLPGGKEILSAQDFYKDNQWNALIHPIGGKKSYKAFCIMWSIHILAYRLLAMSGEKDGTFFILISPEIWSPIIDKESILQGFYDEIKLMESAVVAKIPGLDRREKLNQLNGNIQISTDIESILAL